MVEGHAEIVNALKILSQGATKLVKCSIWPCDPPGSEASRQYGRLDPLSLLTSGGILPSLWWRKQDGSTSPSGPRRAPPFDVEGSASAPS